LLKQKIDSSEMFLVAFQENHITIFFKKSYFRICLYFFQR